MEEGGGGGGNLCPLTLSLGEQNVTLYPITTATELELSLNKLAAVTSVGEVWVEKWVGQLQERQWAMFRVVFQTGMGVRSDDIPTVAVVMDECSEQYTISAGFSQELTTPTFQVGFPGISRETRPLPVINATAAKLERELEELLKPQCSRTTPTSVREEGRREGGKEEKRVGSRYGRREGGK